MRAAPIPQRTTAILVTLCCIQFAGVLGYLVFLNRNGYLPAPFILNKFDTFMDFFNVMDWADNPGRYTDWKSVYPPINFLLTRGIGWLMVGSVPLSDPLGDRALAGWGVAAIIVVFLAVPALVLSMDNWRVFTFAQRVLIWLFFAFSPVVLFATERGNLVIFSLLLTAIALTRPDWARCLAIGILINFKPYCTILLLTFCINRNWKALTQTIAFAGVIFLFSGLILDQNFPLFITNLLSFSQNETVLSGREVLAMPSSLAAFPYVLNIAIANGTRLAFLGFDALALKELVSFAHWSTILGIFFAIVRARRSLTEAQIITVLSIVICNVGIWVGGYSMVVYLALIPILLEFKQQRVYIALIVIIMLPLDAIVLFTDQIGAQTVYVSGDTTEITWQLGAGTVLRPLLNCGLMVLITCELLAYGKERSCDVCQYPQSKG